MKSTDLNPPLTANALNENMYKQFNVKINFDKYTREELENARNILRTKTGSLESTANFNDLLTNETYQKDKYMLGVLNTKIKEMLGESIVLAEKAVSKAQQQAAGIALAAKRKGKKATGGKASAEMSKMSTKELEKFAGTKHKGLPKKVAETSKPDFLDVDKDGNKKETFKKAVKDKSVKEAAKPDFLDMDKDGNKKEPMKKAIKDKKKIKESELKHRAYQQFIAEGIATYIAEDEEGKAKSITAAADMVNDFTSWMQRVGNYQTKSMIELADNIRANFGMQEAETFKASVGTALEGALSALTAAREEINNAVAVLAGEAPAEEQMGMDDSMDTGMEPEMEPGMDDMNPPADEFSAAADAAAGGPETTGRMKRESIERGNRLMRILGA